MKELNAVISFVQTIGNPHFGQWGMEEMPLKPFNYNAYANNYSNWINKGNYFVQDEDWHKFEVPGIALLGSKDEILRRNEIRAQINAAEEKERKKRLREGIKARKAEEKELASVRKLQREKERQERKRKQIEEEGFHYLPPAPKYEPDFEDELPAPKKEVSRPNQERPVDKYTYGRAVIRAFESGDLDLYHKKKIEMNIWDLNENIFDNIYRSGNTEMTGFTDEMDANEATRVLTEGDLYFQIYDENPMMIEVFQLVDRIFWARRSYRSELYRVGIIHILESDFKATNYNS